MRTVLAVIVLLLAGCGDVVVRPQIKLWPDINVPLRPWFKSADEAASIWANVETPEDCKPEPSKPAPPAVAKPEPPTIRKSRTVAAITHDARGQYIVRRGQRCYWSESRKAWREPIKGGCAGGICGYRDIKPGE